MKNTTWFLTVAILAIIAIGAYMFPKGNTVIERIVGAQSESVTEGDCFFFNGLHRCPTGKPFNVASTTICAVKSPAATSTLIVNGATGVRFVTSTSTAYNIVFAKATTAFATTTQIGQTVLYAAAALSTTIATSTTATVILQDTVFPPNNYLVVSMAGGTGSFSPTGTCFAEFVY